LKYLGGEGEGHVQSLILASALLLMGFQTLLVAFLADLLAANRKLLEDLRFRMHANIFDNDASEEKRNSSR
jgi:hypothetical protein